jgi:hypothetical protein
MRGAEGQFFVSSCCPFGCELIEDLCRLIRDRTPCELGVFLRHRRRRVAEELLHLEQAHAALDEPGREGIPKGVTGGATVALDLAGLLFHPARSIALRIVPVLRLRGASSSPLP